MPKTKYGHGHVNVKMPRKMTEAVDRFLRTPVAGDMGVDSRSDLVTRAVSDYLERYNGLSRRSSRRAESVNLRKENDLTAKNKTSLRVSLVHTPCGQLFYSGQDDADEKAQALIRHMSECPHRKEIVTLK
jgi:hypothetical protein